MKKYIQKQITAFCIWWIRKYEKYLDVKDKRVFPPEHIPCRSFLVNPIGGSGAAISKQHPYRNLYNVHDVVEYTDIATKRVGKIDEVFFLPATDKYQYRISNGIANQFHGVNEYQIVRKLKSKYGEAETIYFLYNKEMRSGKVTAVNYECGEFKYNIKDSKGQTMGWIGESRLIDKSLVAYGGLTLKETKFKVGDPVLYGATQLLGKVIQVKDFGGEVTYGIQTTDGGMFCAMESQLSHAGASGRSFHPGGVVKDPDVDRLADLMRRGVVNPVLVGADDGELRVSPAMARSMGYSVHKGVEWFAVATKHNYTYFGWCDAMLAYLKSIGRVDPDAYLVKEKSEVLGISRAYSKYKFITSYWAKSYQAGLTPQEHVIWQDTYA